MLITAHPPPTVRRHTLPSYYGVIAKKGAPCSLGCRVVKWTATEVCAIYALRLIMPTFTFTVHWSLLFAVVSIAFAFAFVWHASSDRLFRWRLDRR